MLSLERRRYYPSVNDIILFRYRCAYSLKFLGIGRIICRRFIWKGYRGIGGYIGGIPTILIIREDLCQERQPTFRQETNASDETRNAPDRVRYSGHKFKFHNSNNSEILRPMDVPPRENPNKKISSPPL